MDLVGVSCKEHGLYFSKSQDTLLKVSKDSTSTLKFISEGLGQVPIEIRKGYGGRIWALTPTSVYLTNCQ